VGKNTFTIVKNSYSLFYIIYHFCLATIAHNVPAVYDVFAVAIKETAGFQQPQKCVWSERGNGA
jgi:hypothetical protein